MEQKRGRLEICRDILKTARAGTGITAIIYGTNLNSSIAYKNIKEMLTTDLITVEVLPRGGGRNKLYTTTERGLAFIKSLEKTLTIFRGLTFSPVIVHNIPIREVSEA